MDDVKFLNSGRRTCDNYPGCKGCDLEFKSCPGYMTYNPIAARQLLINKKETTMKKITVEELGPGVILEVTKPNGKTYQYSIPQYTPGGGGNGAKAKQTEICVFFLGGGENR